QPAQRELSAVELDALGERIALAQLLRETAGDLQDHRGLRGEAPAAQGARQLRGGAQQLVDAIEHVIQNLAQSRRARRGIERLDAETGGGEAVQRQVNPIELAIVVLAVLQVVEQLQGVAQGVREAVQRAVLAVQIEQVPADRRCRERAV